MLVLLRFIFENCPRIRETESHWGCNVAVALTFVCFGYLSANAAANESRDASGRPNIVFILADDLGYGDVKSFGGQQCQVDTPAMDRLAAEGMRFTDAHANASVCVPTRVAIMTGRYPWRFKPGVRGGPWGFLGPRFDQTQHTLGTMFKSADYRTAYIGKWHLGTVMQTVDGRTQGPTNVDYTQPLTHGPPQFGFDESFILPGSLDMYPYVFAKNNQWVGKVNSQKGWSAFNRIGPAADDFEDTKVLGTFCDEAETFIEQVASEEDRSPFFLFLALTSPHTPTSPSEAFKGRSKIGLYGDFVMETDHCVGRVLAALDKHNLAGDTLVIATSDHGPAAYAGRKAKATAGQMAELKKEGHHSNGPFRGYKFSAYEGGLRVPFAARWPGVTPKQSTCDRLIGLPDMMATFADIAGVQLTNGQGPDSFSIVPLLKDPNASPVRDSMILESSNAMVVRSGSEKLLLCPGSGCPGRFGNVPKSETAWGLASAVYGKHPKSHDELVQFPFVQLFDLGADPREEANLAKSRPERVAEIYGMLKRQIADGRSRPGDPIVNDRQNIQPFKGVPRFVWKKPTAPDPKIEIRQTDDHIVASYDGKPVLRYNKSVQHAPDGIAATFDRSGYIHPIYTPSGLEITGDFPPDHAHQHALFNAWTNTTFEGRNVDFWNQAKQLGRVSHAGVIGVGEDEFTVKLLHEDLTGPDGPKPVLEETWTVKIVGKVDGAYVFDLTSVQTCVADTPLTMNQYRYGGMGIRGNNQWYSESGSDALTQYAKSLKSDTPKEFPSLETARHRFTTSEDKRRFEGNHSRPTWVDLSGKIDDKMAGISIIAHRQNFRFPQPVRLHPSKPYFCFAPMVIGEFQIKPQESFVARYRYIAHDGDVDRSLVQKQRQGY